MAFFLSRRQNVIEVFRAKDSAQQGFSAPSVGFNCRSRDSAAENNKESAGDKGQSAKSEEQRAECRLNSLTLTSYHFALCALPFALVRLRLELANFVMSSTANAKALYENLDTSFVNLWSLLRNLTQRGFIGHRNKSDLKSVVSSQWSVVSGRVNQESQSAKRQRTVDN